MITSQYLGDEHANLPVKHGVLGHPRELETTTMSSYKERVRENYKNGCFRYNNVKLQAYWPIDS